MSLEHRYRLVFNFGTQRSKWTNVLNGNEFKMPSGVDLKLEIAIATNLSPLSLYDISNVSTVTLEIKAYNNAPPAPDDPTLGSPIAGTINNPSLTALLWENDTSQHATFTIDSAASNLAGGKYWMVLTATTTDAKNLSIGWGVFEVAQDGSGPTAPVTPLGPSYYTQTQVDNLMVNTVRTNLNITGLTGGAGTDLDNVATATLQPGFAYILPSVTIGANVVAKIWVLTAGTDAENPANGIIRPDDYAAATNEKVWKAAVSVDDYGGSTDDFAANPSSNASFSALAWRAGLNLDALYDPSGAAAAVQSNVSANQIVTDAHIANASNPHGVTADQANAAAILSDQSPRQAISGSLTRQGVRGLAHLKNKLTEISSGLSNRLMIFEVGDSLGYRIQGWLAGDHLAQWFLDPDTVYHDDPVAGSLNARGGVDVQVATTGSDLIKDDYSINWVGSHVDIASGEYAHFSYGNVVSNVDRVLIPYVASSGAGSFKIMITDNNAALPIGQQNNVNWEDIQQSDIASSHTLTGGELIVDCDAAEGLGVVVLEFSASRSVGVQCFHESGGTVQLMHPMFETNRRGAVNVYEMYEGSNNFGDINSASNAKMSALMDALLPDIITVHCDDNGSSAETIADSIQSALASTNLSYEPLVILIGNGPSELTTATQIAQNEAYGRKSIEYNLGFASLLDIAPTYAGLVKSGWEGDGLHLSSQFYRESAKFIAEKFGFDAAQGQAYDPIGLKRKLSVKPYVYDMGNCEFFGAAIVGSATYTSDPPYWEFATGATANSTRTHYLNDYGGPHMFKKASFQIDFDRAEAFAFALQLPLANPEGEFWVHYGEIRNTDGATDPANKDIALKLTNGTPSLQVHNGSTLTEVAGSPISHHTGGSSASEVWITYRIVNAGDGLVYVFQNGNLVIQTDQGPVGGLPNGGFKLGIRNGATAANYQVYITPPIIQTIDQ